MRALHARGIVAACSGALTTRYTIREAAVYAAMGLPVPAAARAPIDFRPLFEWHRGLGPEAQTELDAVLGFPGRELLRALNAHVAPELRV